MSKRNIKIFLGCLAISIVVLGWLSAPHRHTRFAPNFDSDKFDSVNVGSPSRRALDILGGPLSKPIDENQFEYWHYSQPEASPNHMVSRCYVVKGRKVVRVIKETRWDIVGHVVSGGSLFRKVKNRKE